MHSTLIQSSTDKVVRQTDIPDDSLCLVHCSHNDHWWDYAMDPAAGKVPVGLARL